MKIRKILTMFTLLPLLIGCSGDKYAGKYVFQMGKSKDTHMGATLELENNLYDPADASKGKKFTFTLDLQSIGESFLSALLDEGNTFGGSYSVDENTKVYGASSLIMNIYLVGEYAIPADLTNLLFVANIDGSNVTFYLPVSIKDLQLQIYWYGYDIAVIFNQIINDAIQQQEPQQDPQQEQQPEDDDPIPPSPHGEHPFGTHPTQEDIDLINQTYPDSHGGEKYRDFHILKLGLTRQ